MDLALALAGILPRVLDKKHLKIVVFTDGTSVSGYDEGRWFQLLPDLLNISCTVEIELVCTFEWQVRLSPDENSNPYIHAFDSANLRRCTINDYRPKGRLPDAAFFPEGFYRRDSVATVRIIKRLLRAGCPTVGSSYIWYASATASAILRAYGFKVAKLQRNPTDRSRTLWLKDDDGTNESLWGALGAPDCEWIVDAERLHMLIEFYHQSLYGRYSVSSKHLGKWYDFEGRKGGVLAGPGSHGIVTTTGEMVTITEGDRGQLIISRTGDKLDSGLGWCEVDLGPRKATTAENRLCGALIFFQKEYDRCRTAAYATAARALSSAVRSSDALI